MFSCVKHLIIGIVYKCGARYDILAPGKVIAYNLFNVRLTRSLFTCTLICRFAKFICASPVHAAIPTKLKFSASRKRFGNTPNRSSLRAGLRVGHLRDDYRKAHWYEDSE
jgi:hypothetical protein